MNMKIDTLSLLENISNLSSALESCNDWFLLSHWERNPVKKEVYKAIYETKNREYLQVLEEVYDNISK